MIGLYSIVEGVQKILDMTIAAAIAVSKIRHGRQALQL